MKLAVFGEYNVKVYFLTERDMHEPCGFRIFFVGPFSKIPVALYFTVSITFLNTAANKEDDGTVVVWHIVVSLLSGIIIGFLLSHIASCSRRRWFKNRKRQSNPEAQTTEVDTTYLSKMNKEDNYQSLRVNVVNNDAVNDDDSTYTELNKAKDVENNYQSLTH